MKIFPAILVERTLQSRIPSSSNSVKQSAFSSSIQHAPLCPEYNAAGKPEAI